MNRSWPIPKAWPFIDRPLLNVRARKLILLLAFLSDLSGGAERLLFCQDAVQSTPPPIPAAVQQKLDSYNAELQKARASGDREDEAATLNNIGTVYSDLGEKRKALDYYDQALPIVRQLRDRADEALVLNNLGKESHSLGDNQKALDYFTQASSIFHHTGEPDHEAEELSNIGNVHFDLGDKQKAVGYFGQALSIFRQVRDRENEAQMLRYISGIDFSRGNLQKALEYSSQALPIYREVGDRDGEAIALENIGRVYSSFGEKTKALEYLSQALNICREIGDRKNEATIINSIGLVYHVFGDQTRALEYYNQALPIFEQLDDRDGESTEWCNIGGAYSALGKMQEAFEYYNRALTNSRQVGDDAGVAAALNNIGLLYSSLNQPQKAVDSYNEALRISHKMGDSSGEALMLNNVGGLYTDLGQPREALKYFDQALSVARRVGDRRGEAIELSNVGDVYFDLKQPRKMLEYEEQALRILDEVGDRRGQAAALTNLGNAYSQLGEHKKTLSNYQQALSLAIAIRDPLAQAPALSNLMWYWKQEGRSGLAIFIGKQAVDEYQQVRGNLQGLDKGLQQSFVKSVSGTYRELADLLVTEGRLPEARDVLDLLKEQEYRESVRGLPESPSKPVSVNSQEQVSDAEWEQLKKELAADGDRWSKLQQESDRMAAEEQEYQQLDAKITQGNVRMEQFFSRLMDEYKPVTGNQEANHRFETAKAASGSLQTLVSGLGTGTVALYTLVVNDHYRVIVITPTVMVDRETAITADDLRRKVFALTEQLRDKNSDPRAAAQALYQVLVAPVENDLEGAGAKTLVWSLDDVLRYVPMAALFDGKQYLVERYQNVVITEASLAFLDKKPDRNPQVLALGVSKKYEQLTPVLDALPNVEHELDAIVHDPKRSTSGQGVMPGVIALDDDFTEKELAADLGQQKYGLVHIASHFVFTPGANNGTQSYLLLGGKDTGGAGYHLTVQEMATEPALKQGFRGVELLTLSACDTATGQVPSDGKEVDGLATTLHNDGAQAVIATLWKADDAAASQLMVDFYRRWSGATATTKVRALQQAQLDLLKQTASPTQTAPNPAQPNYPRHPYYWAPFILIGNWK